jgi:hypothetical protein
MRRGFSGNNQGKIEEDSEEEVLRGEELVFQKNDEGDSEV